MPLVQTDYGLIYNTDGTLYATLRPGEGRFGGAVAVEEGTENLLSESAFDGLAGVEVANINGWSRVRRITRTSGSLYNTVNIPCDADTEYTMSVYVRAVRVSPGSEFRIYMGDDGDSPNESLYIQPGSEWQRYVLTRRTSPNATRITRASIHLDRLVEGDIIEIADWQLEAKPFATSFVDGTRARGRLVYPPNAFNPTEFTFAAWWKPVIDIPSGFSRIFQLDDGTTSTGRWLALRRTQGSKAIGLAGPNASGTSNVLYVEVTDNYDPNEWQFVACRRSGRDVYVRLNDKVAEATLGFDPAPFNIVRLNIGSTGDAQTVLNGLIDELLILPYAADEQEIQSWYQNGITHVRKPGYYASFDDSLALQYWSEVTYDYRVKNNRVIFTEAPKPEDHILAFYETYN